MQRSTSSRRSLVAVPQYISGRTSYLRVRLAFHLSLTVLVHYLSLWVGSLGGWSPLLPTRLHVSRGTQDPDPSFLLVLYRAFTCSGSAFQRFQVSRNDLMSVLQPHPVLRQDG